MRVKDVETPLPIYKNHLLCDAQGNYPAELNSWEVKVVEAEMKRKGFGFWYRYPQQPGQSSLGIAYLSGDKYGLVRPDFIFFAIEEDGTVVADIVDPMAYIWPMRCPSCRDSPRTPRHTPVLTVVSSL